MRASLYVRVSTEEQREGFSVNAQIEKLRAFCDLKRWKVHRIYVDDGYSGRTTEERPAYQRMMREIDSWDVLVALKLDRLHRNLKNLINMVEELNAKGKHLAIVHENVDTTTAMGRFFLMLMGSLAQLESEIISERVTMGMKQAKKEGYWVGRVPDFFEAVRENGHLKIRPSAVALRILELRESGLSTREISKRISSEIGERVNHMKVWRTLKVFERMNGRATVEIRSSRN